MHHRKIDGIKKNSHEVDSTGNCGNSAPISYTALTPGMNEGIRNTSQCLDYATTKHAILSMKKNTST